MKKICFFSGDITRSGGTERIGTIIANELVKLNYEVIIISLIEKNETPFYKINNKIKRYAIYKNNSTNFKINYLNILMKYRKLIRKERISLIIDIDTFLDIYTIPCRLFLNVKLISWEHFNYYQNIGSKIRKLSRILSSKYSDMIITLTDQDKNYFIENLQPKCQVKAIYNPIDYNEIYEYDKNSKQIISVGRLNFQKGFLLLVEIAKEVLKQNSDWKWVILGEGEDREVLENKIREYGLENQLLLLGNVKNVDDYYKQSAFFVMTSKFEGLPMTLLEAKAFQLPLISFDCKTGPRELIIDNVNGNLVPESNCDDMVVKINRMIEDTEYRNSCSKHALDDTSKFNLVNVMERWKKVLNEVIGDE